MIGILDYGLGNVQAFESIFRSIGIEAMRVNSEEALIATDRLILPGVGAFDWAMSRLRTSGMISSLNRRVLEDKIPVLGVCVGMQIMADTSDEGSSQGLGWIRGKVKRFDETLFNQSTHLPHMGWNRLEVEKMEPLFSGIKNPQFYFLHSYFFEPHDFSVATSYTTYGKRFVSAINYQNIYATQFHPEKSHDWGIRLLKNFSEIN